jgi:aldoxime dehydratase
MPGQPENENGIESAIPQHLTAERTCPVRMREGYTPPYPSYVSRFGEQNTGVVVAMLGVQSPAPLTQTAQDALRAIWDICEAIDGPASREVAGHIDERGFENRMILAYWDEPVSFARWFKTHRDSVIGEQVEVTDHGRWIEVISPASQDIETLYSANTFPEGAATVAAEGFSAEISEHGYWGSMRERLPRAQFDPLVPEGMPSVSEETGIIRVRPHGNLALIRSGQDWTLCGDTEKEDYFSNVEPHLRAGMEFLAIDGPDIGCFANRYMTSCDINGRPLPHSFGLSFWHSMADLEAWAESHPTHVKIFGSAMRFLQETVDVKLRLSHEVSVLPAERQHYEYNNCHSRTGMLGAVRAAAQR